MRRRLRNISAGIAPSRSRGCDRFANCGLDFTARCLGFLNDGFCSPPPTKQFATNKFVLSFFFIGHVDDRGWRFQHVKKKLNCFISFSTRGFDFVYYFKITKQVMRNPTFLRLCLGNLNDMKKNICLIFLFVYLTCF